MGEHVRGDGRLRLFIGRDGAVPEVTGRAVLGPAGARQWLIPTLGIGVPALMVAVAIALQGMGAVVWLRPIRQFSDAVVLRARVPRP